MCNKVTSVYITTCHYVDRANRPNQQTFCCVVCGYSAHADLNAAINIEHRWGDDELAPARTGKRSKPCSYSDMRNGRHKTVGRSPTARPVRSSTGVGEGQGVRQCNTCLDFWFIRIFRANG